jgi:hypothetical protein
MPLYNPAASGSVATDTIFDAKGDLPIGTGADTASKLTVGANGKFLVADSTQSTGLAYSTILFQGKKASHYYMNSGGPYAVRSNAAALNLVHYVPIYMVTGTLDRIAQQHLGSPTASEVLRMGIYTDTGEGWPNALVVDAGTIDLSTAAAKKEITISQAVTSGLYWLALVRQGPTNTATTVMMSGASAAGGNDNARPSLILPTMYSGGTNLYEGILALTEASISGALPSTATPSSKIVVTSDAMVGWVRYA